ncbi:threonine/serine exporter family protein [Nocardioides zeae]|uniref:Threonine/serine exporter family protein n=1 Tax=Nocardioides imazamoxiresistens TaxID=3231893 RepID=A0ABU3PXR4_9ACTN|nr:threonine/serine exporter family protein [Nocardioides zeae]MDT9593954.1 threonine/serine exporter family protein [Nocardioides zeae]
MSAEPTDTRTTNLTLDLCLKIGELLLSSGAGAADVTATMQSVALHLGIRHPEIDVTFTSLAMSYQPDPGDPPITQMRQVKHREIDYDDLTRVDRLVTDVLRDRVDLMEARSRLATIVSSGHQLPRWAVTLSWGLMCGGVTLQLGGSLLVVGLALVAAVLIHRVLVQMARRRLPAFYQQVAGGLVAASLAVGIAAIEPDADVSLMVTANIIMLLAGIGFMAAIQDALTGFYVTGGARVLEALLATAGIIAGVSGGLTLAGIVGVQISPIDPGRAGWEGVGTLALGSAVCAAAFAVASYAPWRSVVPVAVVASAAILLYSAVREASDSRVWAAALAAFGIGLVAYGVAGRVRVPPLVIVVPAIVPMLPGLTIYRGLSLLAEGGAMTSIGLLALIQAASIAVALASGVILGEYVAQPLRREASRLESRLSGPRLVGPLRARTPRRRSRTRTRS